MLATKEVGRASVIFLGAMQLFYTLTVVVGAGLYAFVNTQRMHKGMNFSMWVMSEKWKQLWEKVSLL